MSTELAQSDLPLLRFSGLRAPFDEPSGPDTMNGTGKVSIILSSKPIVHGCALNSELCCIERNNIIERTSA